MMASLIGGETDGHCQGAERGACNEATTER